MDSRRAETLEALAAYIQTQKSLFSRAEADIERLRKLRADAIIQPKAFTENIGSKLNGPELRLSEQQATPLPNGLHWQVFSPCDPTPLRTFAVRTRLAHTERSVPHTSQNSRFSTLQQFVKDARCLIIDPVLENLDPDNALYFMSNSNTFHTSLNQPALSENEDADEHNEIKSSPAQESIAASRRRERAHAKIQQLKERKIRSEVLTEGGEGADAVFVRNDVDDESGEVDISESNLWPASGNDRASMDVDDSADMAVPSTPSTLASSEPGRPLISWPRRHTSTISRRQSFIIPSESPARPSRTRKPSLKLQNQSRDIKMEADADLTPTIISPHSTLGKRSRDPAIAKGSNGKLKTEPSLSVPEPKADTGKARSETYKQAWSESEQHLLDRLLEEIPDGERNRWAKISQAMGGSRTPRQVASRVQKYFEKLKLVGVGVEKKSRASFKS